MTHYSQHYIENRLVHYTAGCRSSSGDDVTDFCHLKMTKISGYDQNWVFLMITKKQKKIICHMHMYSTVLCGDPRAEMVKGFAQGLDSSMIVVMGFNSRSDL